MERIIDNFVSTQPGQPYRLLPFGPIKRATGGPERNVTPELASRFKLPHFQPPIKLGSHADDAPAGGHMKSLFVVGDGNCPLCVSGKCKEHGLWVNPEMTERGAKSVGDGDYKYHSPEIIWPGGGIEDATTGRFIEGPLIVGDALLHVPALGEATALYTSQVYKGEIMSEETMVQVPKNILDLLTAFFKPGDPAKQPEIQKPAPVEGIAPEKFAALQTEKDELAARVKQIEADQLHAVTVTKLAATLKDREKFSATFASDKAATEAAEKLAALPVESQEWVMQQFSALSKRIDYGKITAEIGSNASNTTTNPRQAFAAAVNEKMRKDKVSYADAYAIVKDEAPDLFSAYANDKPKGE